MYYIEGVVVWNDHLLGYAGYTRSDLRKGVASTGAAPGYAWLHLASYPQVIHREAVATPWYTGYMMTPQRTKAAHRAERRLDKTTDHWLWTGPTRNGYGRTTYREGDSIKSLDAHRAMYELYVGEIPEDQQVHHICGVKTCANPEHLEVRTLAENAMIGRPCTTAACECACHVA